MSFSRRDFLKTGAVGVSVSFLAPDLFVDQLLGATPGSDRILVILQLAGGNDAVNTFIPYTDSRYRSMRPTLGIADSAILKVDDRLGFHPSMTKLKSLYEQRKFTFVNNVGFATLDRSHFRCQDVWQTADDSYGQTQRGILGWVGRYADIYLADSPSSLTSVAIGSKIPLGMRSSDVLTAAIPNAESFQVLTDNRYPTDRDSFLAGLRAIYTQQRAQSDTEAVRHHGDEMFESVDLLKAIPPPSASITYPASALGRAFSLVAQTLAGKVGTQAVWISQGGYDTHSAQATPHTNLLTDVSNSLGAFYDDLAQRGISQNVVVLGWSEFGRRVQENASLGTDHGKAGTVFLMGDAIKGGTFYGNVPNLADLDNGDLKTQVDFRSVYWTLIKDWLGKDPLPVLNRPYENLGFIQQATTPPANRQRGARR